MPYVITPRTPQSPYDDGIYRAEQRYVPEQEIFLSDLPGMCGQFPPVSSGEVCQRLALTRNLHYDLGEIERELTHLGRMRNNRSARNLIGWIEFAQRRLTYQMTAWLPLPECTCGERAFPQLTHDLDATYPACTC